jgi:hypothetical protein
MADAGNFKRTKPRVVSGWYEVQDVPRKFGIAVVAESSARVDLRQSRV